MLPQPRRCAGPGGLASPWGLLVLPLGQVQAPELARPLAARLSETQPQVMQPMQALLEAVAPPLVVLGRC